MKKLGGQGNCFWPSLGSSFFPTRLNPNSHEPTLLRCYFPLASALHSLATLDKAIGDRPADGPVQTPKTVASIFGVRPLLSRSCRISDKGRRHRSSGGMVMISACITNPSQPLVPTNIQRYVVGLAGGFLLPKSDDYGWMSSLGE